MPKPLIDHQVNIHSSIRKLEIVSRIPSKDKQKNRQKREDGLGENNFELTTDEVEGEERLEEEKDEKNRGVRLIVDEIDDRSSSSSQIRDRKTFSKQGQSVVKSESAKTMKSGSRQRGFQFSQNTISSLMLGLHKKTLASCGKK